MYFREISAIQDTYQDEARNHFEVLSTRLLLSSDAAGINKGKESYSISWNQSVQCT